MNNNLTISIYSSKGGVGKTSISNVLTRDLQYRYKTNDYSKILEDYKNATLYKNKIPFKRGTLYDFGGWDDIQAKAICLKSDLIIIPVIADYNSLLKNIMLINQLKQYKEYRQEKILIVGNMIKKEEEINQIRTILTKHFGKLNFIFLRNSEVFKNCMNQKKGLIEIFKENGKNSHIYKGIYSDYIKLINYIRELDNLLYNPNIINNINI